MYLITEKAELRCDHGTGKVKIIASQSLVTISGAKVLVETDLEGRTISRCNYTSATFKPCLTTLKIQAGRSPLIRVDGRRVYLDTAWGLTDGAPPPGTFRYTVASPGQNFVQEGSG